MFDFTFYVKRCIQTDKQIDWQNIFVVIDSSEISTFF